MSTALALVKVEHRLQNPRKTRNTLEHVEHLLKIHRLPRMEHLDVLEPKKRHNYAIIQECSGCSMRSAGNGVSCASDHTRPYLGAVPSLDTLADHPEQIADLPRTVRRSLARRAWNLAGDLILGLDMAQEPGQEPQAPEYLTPDDAAAILGVSRATLLQRAKGKPWRVRVSRKVVRIERAGFLRWLAHRT